MTSGIRLLALIAVIALCVWLGFLLGKGTQIGAQALKGTQNEIVSAESLQTVAPVATEDSPPALEPSVYPSDSLTNGPANVSERVNQLGARIDFLAAQTDDKVIAKERYLVLSDLSRELKGADADAFASVVRYYNTVVPRDGAGIILEAQYFEGLGLLPDALDLLIDASEFPESNEQLLLIHNAQAEVIGGHL